MRQQRSTVYQYKNKCFLHQILKWLIFAVFIHHPLIGTFKSICGSRCKVLVWVKLEGQLSVRLLQVVLAGIFGNTEDFIKVLAVLYPAATQRDSQFQPPLVQNRGISWIHNWFFSKEPLPPEPRLTRLSWSFSQLPLSGGRLTPLTSCQFIAGPRRDQQQLFTLSHTPTPPDNLDS